MIRFVDGIPDRGPIGLYGPLGPVPGRSPASLLSRAAFAILALSIPTLAIGTVRPPFLDRPAMTETHQAAAADPAWHAAILEVKPGLVIIAAGDADGIHRGDRLKVVRPGHRIRPREDLVLQLPPDDIARLVVLTSVRTRLGADGTACAILDGDSIALSDRVERENGL